MKIQMQPQSLVQDQNFFISHSNIHIPAGF